jgi:hypothetical protein
MITSAPVDPWTPNYGCFVGDWVCAGTQTVANFMASSIVGLGDFIGSMLSGAFNTNIDQSSWDVAHGQFLFWIAVTSPVILIIALVQIGIAMVLQDWSRIGRTAAGAALAIPFSAICVWAMQQFSAVSDDVTGTLTTTIQGGDLSSGLLRVLGLAIAPTHALDQALIPTQFTHDSAIYAMAQTAAATREGVGQYLLALGVVAIMAVASLFLFIAMSIREFGLLALAALAPIGLMMIGQPKLGVWSQRWLSLTTGLILAKPLAAGVVLLAVELTKSTVNVGVLLVACGAIIAASFSPLWATKLVSFAGAEVGTALHQRPSVRNQISRASTAAAPVRAVTRVARIGR